VDRNLVLKLSDPSTRSNELGAGRARQLAGVDQLLSPPGGDGLI
jgi:hypothetical protein